MRRGGRRETTALDNMSGLDIGSYTGTDGAQHIMLRFTFTTLGGVEQRIVPIDDDDARNFAIKALETLGDGS